MAPVSRMAAGHITCLSGDESRTMSSIVERISVLYVVGDNNNGSSTSSDSISRGECVYVRLCYHLQGLSTLVEVSKAAIIACKRRKKSVSEVVCDVALSDGVRFVRHSHIL